MATTPRAYAVRATADWIVLVTWLYSGATRDSSPRSPYASHTAPAPTATPVGVAFSEIVLSTVRRFESTRDSVRSSRFATQTAPWPTATPSGLVPTGTWPTT